MANELKAVQGANVGAVAAVPPLSTVAPAAPVRTSSQREALFNAAVNRSFVAGGGGGQGSAKAAHGGGNWLTSGADIDDSPSAVNAQALPFTINWGRNAPNTNNNNGQTGGNSTPLPTPVPGTGTQVPGSDGCPPAGGNGQQNGGYGQSVGSYGGAFSGLLRSIFGW